MNEKKGLTFARGLRSILRHDPDKVMVGEIRDCRKPRRSPSTPRSPGTPVFTTVHANNVLDVLGRFLNMGVEAYNFVSRAQLHPGAAPGARDLSRIAKHAVKYDEAYLVESGLNLRRLGRRHVLRRHRLLRMRRHGVPWPQRHLRIAGSLRAHP